MQITKLTKYIRGTPPPHFRSDPGVEAYQYYMDLSMSGEYGVIADLGTYQGLSALALSANPEVKVLSYDITLEYNMVEKSNIKFIQGDVFKHIDEILKADLILIDLDPHDGIQEEEFYDVLLENEYKGMTVWDDINRNVGMKTFWHRVELPKEEIKEGHHSGTGSILFI